MSYSSAFYYGVFNNSQAFVNGLINLDDREVIITAFIWYGFIISCVKSSNKKATSYSFANENLHLYDEDNNIINISNLKLYTMQQKRTFRFGIRENGLCDYKPTNSQIIERFGGSLYSYDILNGYFSNFISIWPEEWVYQEPDITQVYNALEYPVIKFVYNNTTYYKQNNGINSIESQCASGSNYAILKACGNYFLSQNNNWTIRRNLKFKQDNDAKEYYQIDPGYSLKENSLSIIQPYDPEKYCSTEEKSKYYHRKVDEYKSLYEDFTNNTFSTPRILYNSFFEKSDGWTKANWDKKIFWLDPYTLYCDGTRYVIPDDWTVGVYHAWHDTHSYSLSQNIEVNVNLFLGSYSVTYINYSRVGNSTFTSNNKIEYGTLSRNGQIIWEEEGGNISTKNGTFTIQSFPSRVSSISAVAGFADFGNRDGRGQLWFYGTKFICTYTYKYPSCISGSIIDVYNADSKNENKDLQLTSEAYEINSQYCHILADSWHGDKWSKAVSSIEWKLPKINGLFPNGQRFYKTSQGALHDKTYKGKTFIYQDSGYAYGENIGWTAECWAGVDIDCRDQNNHAYCVIIYKE